MKNSLIYIIIAILTGFIVNLLVTRSNLKHIEKQIESTTTELRTISLTLGTVITSIKLSTNELDSVLVTIDQTRTSLEELNANTYRLSKNEKNKLQHSIESLTRTKKDIETEQSEARQLIEKLEKSIPNEK
jgi:DNA repair ATPase RecN